MKTAIVNRRHLLLGGATSVMGFSLMSSLAAAQARYDLARLGTGTALTRRQLEGFIDRYLDALVAHDPRLAPFSPDAVFAENDVLLPLGTASWKTIERLGRYRHYFADPQNGDAGIIATVFENGSGSI